MLHFNVPTKAHMIQPNMLSPIFSAFNEASSSLEAILPAFFGHSTMILIASHIMAQEYGAEYISMPQ